MTARLVELRDVVKAYDTPAGAFLALRGVDLTVDAGEFVAVIGKSGSGKSTLINAIAGIDRPTSGEVFVAGAPVHSLDENDVAVWRGANLGVIFQFFQLLPTLTLVENVVLPMEFARRGTAAERVDRAMALLDRVGMGEHAEKLPAEVSGGQQQRVAIARALANDPALIVADEPTGSLDSRTADTVFQLFEELVDQGKTILMVTHDNDLAARANRVVLIVDGEVVESHVRTALAGVSEEDLVELGTRLEPHALAAGTTVFAQGDVADRFYIVVRGTLEVARRRLDGTEHIVAELGPGEYFGEVGLLTGAARNAAVRVSRDGAASVVSLDADVFRHLVADNHLANDSIARLMRERLDGNLLRDAIGPAEAERVDLQSLPNEAVRVEFAPGETILAVGDAADRFSIVVRGSVEVLAEDGSVAYRYRPGRHFGAAGLSRDGRSIAWLRAGEDGAAISAIAADLYRRVADQTGMSPRDIARLITGTDGPGP